MTDLQLDIVASKLYGALLSNYPKLRKIRWPSEYVTPFNSLL